MRIGLPAPLWEGLAQQVEDVARAALKRLEAAGVVFVPVAMSELNDLNGMVGGPIAIHEARGDVNAWLVANQAPVQTVSELAARIASPDVRAIYDAVIAGSLDAHYEAALNHWRPLLQAYIAATFADERLDALLFPPHGSLRCRSTRSTVHRPSLSMARHPSIRWKRSCAIPIRPARRAFPDYPCPRE